MSLHCIRLGFRSRTIAVSFLLLVAGLPVMSRAKEADEKLAGQATPITHGLRVFTCGHSFHYWIPGILSDMAKSVGIEGHEAVGLSAIAIARVGGRLPPSAQRPCSDEIGAAGARFGPPMPRCNHCPVTSPETPTVAGQGADQLAHLAPHVQRLGKLGIGVVGQENDGELARVVKRALVGLLAGPHAVDIEHDRLTVEAEHDRFQASKRTALGKRMRFLFRCWHRTPAYRRVPDPGNWRDAGGRSFLIDLVF